MVVGAARVVVAGVQAGKAQLAARGNRCWWAAAGGGGSIAAGGGGAAGLLLAG